MERYKVPHHRWVYLSDDRRGGMGQDLAYNLKMVSKGRIERTPGLKLVAK